MSKYDVTNGIKTDDYVSRFLMGALGETLKDKEKREFLMYKDALGNIVWDIKLTANGIELEFIEVLQRYQEQWERCLKDQAKELIDETFGNIINNVQDIANDMKGKLLDMAHKKLGIPVDDY